MGFISEKFLSFLQLRLLDHQVIACNPTAQDDGRTGADIVPDRLIQVVSDPAGDAHHLVFFPDVTELVFKAAVAGIEVGPQSAAAVKIANNFVLGLVF